MDHWNPHCMDFYVVRTFAIILLPLFISLVFIFLQIIYREKQILQVVEEGHLQESLFQ